MKFSSYWVTALFLVHFSILPSFAADQTSRIAALEARIAQLEATLARIEQNSALQLDGKVNVNGTTIQFAGVNLQVVNGLGTTDQVNGLGNLIVGYDEPADSSELPNTCSNGDFQNRLDCLANGDQWSRVHKSGSHNLIVGPKNNYSQSSGIVSGKLNTLSAPYASVTAGSRNRVSGDGGHISGGTANHAFGFRAIVVGGENNSTGNPTPLYDVPDFFRNGNYAVVLGGRLNEANDAYASVVGGVENRAEGQSSVVTGGFGNLAGSNGDVVTGGIENRADSSGASVISGGVRRVLTDSSGAWVAGELVQDDEVPVDVLTSYFK